MKRRDERKAAGKKKATIKIDTQGMLMVLKAANKKNFLKFELKDMPKVALKVNLKLMRGDAWRDTLKAIREAMTKVREERQKRGLS